MVEEPPRDPTAEYAVRTLSVNGHNVQCPSYSVDGSSYFRIQDLAYLLSGTCYRFRPILTEASIFIRSGETYVSQGGELTLSESPEIAQTARLGVTLDSTRRADITAYQIAGNSCIRLLDLGAAMGFAVEYDADTAAIHVNFDDPESGCHVPYYTNHYGVPNFHRVVGAEPCAENELIHAYSISALKKAEHTYDCVAVYADALRDCGFVHTQKFSDSGNNPVALFESDTRNVQILLGSAVIGETPCMTVVLLSGNDSTSLVDKYEHALSTL